MGIYSGKPVVRGPFGKRGPQGKGVYEIWLEENEGTVLEFLEDMRSKVPGPVGPSIFDEWNEDKIERGEDEGTYEDFLCYLMDSYFGIGIIDHISSMEAGIVHNSLDIAILLARIRSGDIAGFLRLCEQNKRCIGNISKVIKDNKKDFLELENKVKVLTIDSANRSESEAMYKRAQGQTGILAARNYYTTNNSFKRRHTNPVSPSHIHSHPDYRGLVGSGEIQFVANGLVGQTRHRDYKLEESIQGSYLATRPIEQRPHSPEFKALSFNDQVIEMKSRFERYENGEFPEGFSFKISILEVWLEEFSPNLTETYASDRHQFETSSLEAAIELLNYHSTSGFKPVFENVTFEPTVVRYVDHKGDAKIGILKNRMVCTDLTSMGDLRENLSVVNDPSAVVGRRRTERWKLDDCLDGWTIMDEIMSNVPGMDGGGSVDTENYSYRGELLNIQKHDKSGDLNSSYYSRKGSRSRGAGGLSSFNRGFSDPMLFVATTNHSQVSEQSIYGIHKRYSYAIPMELILSTPLDGWNPHEIPFKSVVSGNGTQADPRDGYNYIKNYFINPIDVFTDPPGGRNPASTGVNTYYTTLPDGRVVKVAGSGEWVSLPAINGISTKRRFPIYVEHQEGSKAHIEATESWIDSASGIISNSMKIFHLESDQMKNSEEFLHLQSEMQRIHDCMTSYNVAFASSIIKSSMDVLTLQMDYDVSKDVLGKGVNNIDDIYGIISHIEHYISDIKAGSVHSSFDVIKLNHLIDGLKISIKKANKKIDHLELHVDMD